jgi:DNA polymerase I-like protein with 3'-5' exonuclease and polymerase domains
MKIQRQDVGQAELTKQGGKNKVKKPKEPKNIRYTFRKALKELSIPKLKKPWMAQKAFRLITTAEELQAWVDSVLSDTSRHMEIKGALTPVIALDTEATGLDTRILVDRVQKIDGSWEHIYEVNVELAGICLSSDGMDGIYIPINHEKQDQDLLIPAQNIDRQKCAEILQYLFDRCHLVFYNAKFDREILRLTMGINFRPYPYFEDVQVLAYINDPKADLGDKGGFSGDSGGLKALSKNVLGIEQIELKDVAKVKCDYCPVTGGPFCTCDAEQRKAKKHSLKNQYVPFTWIPTDIALWYAAGDAICTWLLWKKMYELAQSRKLIHRIDHELVETITWIERQRWVVDTARLARTVKGHSKKIKEMRNYLRQLALAAGYEEPKQDDGVVLEEDQFNPGSTMQLQTLFFKVKGYTVTKFTATKNPSCDAEVLEDLYKEHPEDEFLKTILQYRDYIALHPDNLKFDPRDHSARIYLKQNVVAGGRLSAAGGEFERDGGFGLNPQGIKKVESYLMWKVNGNVLDPDPEDIRDEDIEEYTENELREQNPSCLKEVEEEVVVGYKPATDDDGELLVLQHHEPRGTIESIERARTKTGHTYCSNSKFLKSKLQSEADNRHDAHKGQDSSRPLSENYELLGLIGEAQGEADFNVPRDSRILPQGDGRKDGEIHGYSIDWKVARKAYNVLMEEGKPHADILVAGMWHEDGDQCWVEWLGWEWRDELKKVKAEGFGHEVLNHYRAVDNLRPMSEFKSGNLSNPSPSSAGMVPIIEKQKVSRKAPGIIKNHIGKYMGYAICLQPECKTCAEKYGILIPNTKMDANEVVNLRALFHAPPGWTLFSVDYGNIEMRAAANCSGEPEFIKEFLQGKGDFHSLTASKVFPEFNDPATSKAVRKSLRELAKIINFALLYGGTEYTIFENMKKKKPDITWEEAKNMVAKYWEGVPVFFDFCQKKQYIAKNEMLCKTSTGRVINFESAMEALHIHHPTEEETENYWKYRELMKKAEEIKKKEDDPERAAKYRAMADRMWKDSDTGVRNAMDFNKFMGKIQRVAVNAPLQGLAGDFMRMALNRIRKWVESDPLIQAVFHLHCSVHDEIDFIVKNEYVPFILPRITRLMKLRTLHEKMKWPVPIECDAEYGHTWDVEHHVTGDDDHKPAAWTEIKEVATYIPEGWDIATLKNLIHAVGTGEELRIARAKTFLEENLHPRAFITTKYFFDAKDDKTRKKALIATLQLDEFWRNDNVPDNEDDRLESLADYEHRNGLTSENRDPLTPEFGYLGAIPLTANVKRPTLEILGEPMEPEAVDIMVSKDNITVIIPENPVNILVSVEDFFAKAHKTAKELDDSVLSMSTNVLNLRTEEPQEEAPVPKAMAMTASAQLQELKETLRAPVPEEESVFVDIPMARSKKVVEQVVETATDNLRSNPYEMDHSPIPNDGKPLYELIDMDEPACIELMVRMGNGNYLIPFLYHGKVRYLRNKATSVIPKEFIKAVHGVSEVSKP